MSQDVLQNAFGCIHHGLGYPNMKNDQVLIKSAMFLSNYTEEDARTWAARACIVPCPETKNALIPARLASCTPLGSKCVELALWNGFNPVFNMQTGPKTGDATKMKSFDELFEAALEQYKIIHREGFKIRNIARYTEETIQLAGDKGFDIFKAYIETWCDLGINHVQFNMVDNETLLAAQKQPEDYSELFVRVAGYSATFIELNKRTQDTIIARTVQEP